VLVKGQTCFVVLAQRLTAQRKAAFLVSEASARNLSNPQPPAAMPAKPEEWPIKIAVRIRPKNKVCARPPACSSAQVWLGGREYFPPNYVIFQRVVGR
jgi:hypothetical protein